MIQGAQAAKPGRPAPSARSRRIGVIDIGSGSIRLVVFDGLTRSPLPIFNEKVDAALGRSVEKTGFLSPEGKEQAFSTLARFSRLLDALDVASCNVVATAAVRDARDGAAFLAEVKTRTTLDVEIISGEEEGRLSAEGVLSGIPGADGVMGDMGGGSVELVRLSAGAVGARTTMPFGPMRLMAKNEPRDVLAAIIDSRLSALSWLREVKGATVYAVGGIWRAFATVHMEQVGHPIHIIHHYEIEAQEAVEFAQFLSKLSRASLEGSGIPRRRVEAMPYAAMFMEVLLKRARPRNLVFSAFGLREGIVYDLLPPEERTLDPLLSACEDMAARIGRSADGRRLADWLGGFGPPFESNDRLLTAVCLLSDIGWLEHPDYRAQQAYLKTLRAPFSGIDHKGRAFIALALHLRYGGRVDDLVAEPSHSLLDDAAVSRAVALGLALRLAYKLCGGALALLDGTRLARERDRVVLRINRRVADLKVESVDRRLDALGKVLGLGTEIRIV